MSSELSASLPWDQLERRREDVPWPVLHAFADALAEDRALIPRLIEVYDRAYEAASDQSGYTDFYVAGIFALAAPSLDDETRREIGSLLVARLARAGRDDADLSLEVLTAAAGTMGPVILPAVLDAIAAEPDTRGAWVFLWSLTVLAAGTDDQGIRDRVVQVCIDLLERIDHGQADPADGTHAAWTLATLKRHEHKGLLRRLIERPKSPFWDAEYEEALDLLEDRMDYTPRPEIWEEPVEEWLASRCGRIAAEPTRARDYGEYEEDEELTEAREQESTELLRAGLLAMSFCSSPVASGLPHELRKDAHFIVRHLLYHSFTDLDLEPSQWDESTLRELLLKRMPRVLAGNEHMIPTLVPITEAFLYWLHMDEQLIDADALARTVHGWADQVAAAARDLERTAPGESPVTEARKTGMDMDIADARIQRAFEEDLAAHPDQPTTPEKREPAIPIVEHRTKVARNAPCPCGSGKKYKKCHGRSETATPAD